MKKTKELTLGLLLALVAAFSLAIFACDDGDSNGDDDDTGKTDDDDNDSGKTDDDDDDNDDNDSGKTDDDDDSDPPPPKGETLDVNADIKSDTTWKAGNTYILKKHIFVDGATLTIEKGVTVKGEMGTSLVVATNGKINAVGTKDYPIVFTSSKPEGDRHAGDWGGVVLLGKAKLNITGGTEKVEGFPATETRTVYGGSDDTHDCGTIKYARIEFAGFELAPDNELNGLTLGGCGSKTTLEYIQIHMGADDGIEFFGGTANVKYLVVSEPDDDGIDWDFGYSGKIQFAIVHQNAVVGDKGMECDSNKNNNDAEPRSNPQLWNITLAGSNSAPGTAGKEQSGIHFRRGTAGKVNNMVMAYFADYGVNISDNSTVQQFKDGNLAIKNSIFWSIGGKNDALPVEAKDDDEGFEEEKEIMNAGHNNKFADPKFNDPHNYDSPNFTPAADSPVFEGGATPPNDGFFDASATFIGAIGKDDWTKGWTAYPAN